MRPSAASRPIAALTSSASCSSSPSTLAASSVLSQRLRACATSQQLPFAAARAFSTTLPQQSKTIKAHRLPSDLIPPYPYGDRRVYKQSNRGLYGHARIRFGNIIARKGLSKARRYWKPNVHVKNFYVAELRANIKTRLTLRVLKTIRRDGGLAEYLLKSKPARIREMGPSGWRLRWLIMQTRAVQERFNEERKVLGLETREIVDNDDLIHYAMDYATPGPLSARSRELVAQMQAVMEDIFDIGDDIPEDAEMGEELSDESEDRLLNGLDSDAEIKTKTEKEGVHV